MNEAGQLRRLVESRKQSRIDKLLSLGVYKLSDGRDLYEGTLTELDREVQYTNLKKRGLTIVNHKQKRLVDTLIATKFYGWSNVTRSGKVSAVSWYDAGGNATYKIKNFRPTEDLNQAMDLLWAFESYTLASSPEGHICELSQNEDIVADTEAETIAMAICLAVIDAKEIRLQDYQSVDDLLEKDVVTGNEKMHSTCLRCNRPLKSKESQLRGYGPGCWKKEYEQPNLISLLSKTQEEENFVDELQGQLAAG